jgi:teichuronic acid biosynthesis glycosyltransferase TuaH
MRITKVSNPGFIIFGGAELPWIYPLGVELAAYGPTALISLGTFARELLWPFDDEPKGLIRLNWAYPPGFNGKFSFFFVKLIQGRLNKIIDLYQRQTGVAPYVIVPEPSFEKFLPDQDRCGIIYWNYDDYSVGRTGEAALRFKAAEELLLKKAKLILTSSHRQSEKFKQYTTSKAHSIFHFPHGVQESFLNPSPELAPGKNRVCCVGSLTDRYNWQLIFEVTSRLPNVEFIFVGEKGYSLIGAVDWYNQLRSVLELPNVKHLSGLKHRETNRIFHESALSWMPYDVNSPFVKASSPLKLMCGLASGFPIVSADVPECRLYPNWVSIYQNVDEAVSLINKELFCRDTHSRRERKRVQMQFADQNTWAMRAVRLLDLITSNEGQV